MSEQKGWYEIFTRFFMKYFVIGVALIIVSIVYANELQPLIRHQFLLHFVNVVNSLLIVHGPSILVASLFTFSIESRHFVDYIKGNLENVMIKKEFS